MFEVRLHGRGGQGVVTAAELLSVAAFMEGREAQAFPSFGSERTGAPVMSFCRIADTVIRTREPVTHPDALVILDATLLHHVDLFSGFRDDGYLLVNAPVGLADLGVSDVTDHLPVGHAAAFPATNLAMEMIGRPVPNAALVAGLAALTGIVSLPSVHAAIRARFSGEVGEANVAVASRCHELVLAAREVVSA